MKRPLPTSLLLLFVVACKPTVKQHDMTPLPTPEAALQEIRAKSGHRKNLRTLGRVTYFGEQGRVRVKTVIVAERPGSFRLETISPFEQPIDVMACNGDRLWLLNEKRLREGPATPENIARLLPLAMHPREVVDTLLGGVPTSSQMKPKTLEWSEDGKHWILTMESAYEQSRLVIDPVRRIVTELRLSYLDAESPRLVVKFDDFEQLPDAGELPMNIDIEMPARDLEVSIRLKEVEVDVEIAASLFSIQAPPGVTPEPLDSPPVALP